MSPPHSVVLEPFDFIEAYKKNEKRPRISKSWFGTHNNYSEEDFQLHITLSEVTFSAVGKELSQEGTPHLQFCHTFKMARSFKQMKELFPTAHFEVPRNIGACRDYCRKERRATIRDFLAPGTRTEMTEALELIKEGATPFEVICEMPSLIRYMSHLEKFRSAWMEAHVVAKVDVNCIVFFGLSGRGKSARANELYPDSYTLKQFCHGRGWFNGYKYEKTLILEDYNGQLSPHVFLSYTENRVSKLRLEVKNSHAYANWDRVVIISNVKPEVWYCGACPAVQEAVISRIDEVCEFTGGNLRTVVPTKKTTYQVVLDDPEEVDLDAPCPCPLRRSKRRRAS